MGTHEYHQVDVFSDVALGGNALGVVMDSGHLDDETMQRFARWTNLAEVTFLSTPTQVSADYSARIFTSESEIPFAGHPTLGSAYVWLTRGGVPATEGVIVQECHAGLIKIRMLSDGLLAFSAPPLTRHGPVDEPTLVQIAYGLGIERVDILDASWLVNGPEWIGVRLANAGAVLALQPRRDDLRHLVGVIGAYENESNSDAHVEVRAFLPGDAMFEDVATGSLAAGMAEWLIADGKLPHRYVVSQGTAIGRAARLNVEMIGDTIWIAGRVTPAIHGRLRL